MENIAVLTRRYACAILSIAVAAGVRLALNLWFTNRYSHTPFIFAILLSAWYGGFGPSFAALVLSLCVAPFVVAPQPGEGSTPWDLAVGLILYLTLGLGIALLGGTRRANQRRANAFALDVLEQQQRLDLEHAQRRQAEESVRESEQRFTRFMQHLPGLAWIKDLDGRYVFINDAALDGFDKPSNELYGKTDDEIFLPKVAAQFKENDRRTIATKAGVIVIEQLPHRDGLVHHSVVSKFPIFGSDGDVVLVGGMAIDITDRLRYEDALKEADRRKDEFLAMLAHELRNPLAPVRNALQIIQLAGNDRAATSQACEMMERQVEQMVRLIDDLLDVSRISRGKIELRKERVELSALVRNAVETCRPVFEALHHELSIELPPDPIYLDGDPIRLAQVFGNLLNNSAKYTESFGHIRLHAEQAEEEIVLRVTDDGIGIPSDMLSGIFEMFVQVDRSLGRAQGGLGIGLTLVKSLVEMHGGAVEAHSEGPGLGSEFVVRLPLQGPGEPMETSATPTANGQSMATVPVRRILVVDDNHDAADSLAMLLQLMGHDVRVAHDGPAALDAARVEPPELAILDIGMPAMDGYELARRLRQEPALNALMLVALTGWGQEEDRQRSQDAGFDYHLTKPVDKETLQRLLSYPV